MGRIEMPGSMPAEIAECASDPIGYMDKLRDRWDESIRAENEHAAKKNAPQYVTQYEFWKEECIDGPTYIGNPLSECMAALPEWRKGNKDYAMEKIIRALMLIEKQATPVAEKALLEIYEGDA